MENTTEKVICAKCDIDITNKASFTEKRYMFGLDINKKYVYGDFCLECYPYDNEIEVKT